MTSFHSSGVIRRKATVFGARHQPFQPSNIQASKQVGHSHDAGDGLQKGENPARFPCP